jgi:hypothetical protein
MIPTTYLAPRALRSGGALLLRCRKPSDFGDGTGTGSLAEARPGTVGLSDITVFDLRKYQMRGRDLARQPHVTGDVGPALRAAPPPAQPQVAATPSRMPEHVRRGAWRAEGLRFGGRPRGLRSVSAILPALTSPLRRPVNLLELAGSARLVRWEQGGNTCAVHERSRPVPADPARSGKTTALNRLTAQSSSLAPVFRTRERRAASLAGSIPIRLDTIRLCRPPPHRPPPHQH